MSACTDRPQDKCPYFLCFNQKLNETTLRGSKRFSLGFFCLFLPCLCPFVSLFFSSMLFSGSVLPICCLAADPIVSLHGELCCTLLGRPLGIAAGLTWRRCGGLFAYLCWLAADAVGSGLPDMTRAWMRRIQRKEGFTFPPKPCPELLTMWEYKRKGELEGRTIWVLSSFLSFFSQDLVFSSSEHNSSV